MKTFGTISALAALILVRGGPRWSQREAIAADGQILNQLPSAERLVTDLKGGSDRDTLARRQVGLSWLIVATSAENMNDLAKRQEYVGMNRALFERAKPALADSRENSAFHRCSMFYETSPAFIGAVLDRYFSPEWQLQHLATMRTMWQRALAPTRGRLRAFPAAPPECTLPKEQVPLFDTAAAQTPPPNESLPVSDSSTIAQLATGKGPSPSDHVSSDADAKTSALGDGLRAKGHVDMAVFGIPLGVELPAPNCETVGEWKDDPLQATIGCRRWLPGDCQALPKVMVSAQTCLLNQSNGQTSIHWGDGVLPKWAQSVKTNIKDGVLMSVTIVFDSAATPPTGRVGIGPSGAMAVAVGNNLVQSQYENAVKVAAENVSKAQKDLLRKYGKPRNPVHTARYTNGRAVQEPEWSFPGLHVRYDSGTYQDSILIEVESLFKARSESQQKQEAAEPKL